MKNPIDSITLDTSDLYPYFLPGQLEALQSFITQNGYDDPVPNVIAETVTYIHSQSKSSHYSPKNPFAIPKQLKIHACLIAIDILSTQLPGLELSSDQIRNIKHSRKYIECLSKGQAKLVKDKEEKNVGLSYSVRKKQISKSLKYLL